MSQNHQYLPKNLPKWGYLLRLLDLLRLLGWVVCTTSLSDSVCTRSWEASSIVVLALARARTPPAPAPPPPPPPPRPLAASAAGPGARPRAGGGGGTGAGSGGRGRGVARSPRTRPPRHSTFWDSARLTTIGIQVVNKVRDGCSTPRLLLLSVSAFTDARRQTQLLEVHGVLEDGHPPRVHRIFHFRVFEK